VTVTSRPAAVGASPTPAPPSGAGYAERDWIPLSAPDVGDAERQALLRAFDSGWVAPLGPEVDLFEAELAAACGRSYAVALASGTAALHLALLTAGVRRGDRVLCSTLTFVASANAISYCGAIPVFVDSSPDSWTIDPDLVAAELARAARTGELPAAVVAVDLFGQCADYPALLEVCGAYGVPVLSDAAESLGASYCGRPSGSFGDCAIVSFNGNKILTTSGGGALLTDDAEQAVRVRSLATQARLPVPHYQHEEVGFNYRLSNLLAAVGRAQLAGLAGKVGRRRDIRREYEAGLGDLAGVGFMPVPADSAPNHWLTVLTVDAARSGFSPDSLRLALAVERIEARPVWKPMHLQPVYADAPTIGGSVAEHAFANGLCLPSSSTLDEDQQGRVIQVIREHAEGKR
jgi:dTDP-4-amino-4,6-dideoxygalactose transaminase